MTSKASHSSTKNISYVITDNISSIKIQIKKDKVIITERSFDMKELNDISLYWKFFDSIKEIAIELSALSKSNKIQLKHIGGNSYDLILSIHHGNIKTITLPIYHKDNTINNSDALDNTDSSLVSLKNRVLNHMDLCIDGIYSKIEALENRLNDYLDALYIRLKSLETKGFVHQEEDDKSRVSTKVIPIVKMKEEDMIYSWLPMKIPFNLKLIYNPSDGLDTAQECIKCIYDISPLLIVIKSDNGSIFGGYTSVGWDCPKEKDWDYKKDNDAFLFSVDKKKKYGIRNDHCKEAISCGKAFVICFTGGIGLENHFMYSRKNKLQLYYYGANDPKYELNNGSSSFQVKQLHVYHIQ